jgi:protein involved in polysaccharide export with SLBB domain
MIKKDADNSAGEYTAEPKRIINAKKIVLTPLFLDQQLFDNPTLNFEPNLKLATPMNYILGPGDELQVSVYGVQEYNAVFPSVEGKVSIQYVGEISVSGMSIEAATQKKKRLWPKYIVLLGQGQSQVLSV